MPTTLQTFHGMSRWPMTKNMDQSNFMSMMWCASLNEAQLMKHYVKIPGLIWLEVLAGWSIVCNMIVSFERLGVVKLKQIFPKLRMQSLLCHINIRFQSWIKHLSFQDHCDYLTTTRPKSILTWQIFWHDASQLIAVGEPWTSCWNLLRIKSQAHFLTCLGSPVPRLPTKSGLGCHQA